MPILVARNLLILSLLVLLLQAGCMAPPTVRDADELRCGGATGRACQLSLLAIEPDDGVGPLVARFAEARSSIDYVPFALQDQRITKALRTAQARGVHVRVMLEPEPDAASKPGESAADLLTSLGIEWHRTNSTFAVTDARYAVLDGTQALIMTFDSTAADFRSRRDFGLIDDDPEDAHFLQALFDADWSRTPAPAIPTGFAVSPDNSNPALIGLVDSAHKTLAIYTERLEPSPLFDAVVQATQRGVLVRVLGAPISQKERSTIGFAELTRGGKFDIRTPPRPRVHAALMIVDGNNVFLGSENIDDSPAEQRRGLGIMFAEPSIAARLSTVFEQDWQSSPADPWRQVPR